MTDLPPAGWYPDPDDAGLIRYWDGEAWTQDRRTGYSDLAQGPAQPPVATTTPPRPLGRVAWVAYAVLAFSILVNLVNVPIAILFVRRATQRQDERIAETAEAGAAVANS